jgi:hypothetical protein
MTILEPGDFLLREEALGVILALLVAHTDSWSCFRTGAPYLSLDIESLLGD